MRERVRSSEYIVTLHARKEMNDDDLVADDVERAILTGKVLERQRDRVTAEWKYIIRGIATDDRPVEVVAKLGPTGRLIVITVYAP